ncbi:AT-rich interactive domain-containing protein 5A isoform X2 [Sceloporus undulatus]|uniref:AT-rich interactive domain-containing protein 5A isoform X2 n=1 Tax=Sceloporus undulatus TaxID=8520 RepID=UPI001C4D3A4C|nr:AT-rich interactive domain-containing protein 5A isoform X2 [Sceloporus undulatus]
MAPSFKGKRKKRIVPMAEEEPQQSLEMESGEEAAEGSPDAKEQQSIPEKLEDVESPASKPDSTSETEQKSPAEESGDDEMPIGEKEEEQTFLVNLYKFMKDRHTPIERVPHLGFKQINLFKIYKVVEKLGAYELVTGRRLWKNVYNMLGGSPGSTSAATCTRRHYERLVLPYVRHLKGEDDKPLPPVKPRKQYKISKEPKGERGNGVVEKKRAKKEKVKDQVLQEKLKPDIVVASAPSTTNETEQKQPTEQTEGHLSLSNGREMPDNQRMDACNCKAHGGSEASKRLFSSFYFKGNHGIMSPLAKKKLLAQVSKDEALYCHERHLSTCPQYKKTQIQERPGLNPEAGTKTPLVSHHLHKEGQSNGAEKLEGSGSPLGSSQASRENEGIAKVCPGFRTSQGPQKADGGSSGGHPSPGLPTFCGSFYTSRSDIVKPVSCHPIRGPLEYYPGLRDLTESPSSFQSSGKNVLSSRLSQKRPEDPEEQPEDLRRKPLPSWRGDATQSSAFQPSSSGSKRGSSSFLHIKPSWVPPMANMAKVSPQIPKSGGPSLSPSPPDTLHQKKRALEEDFLRHGKKLKAVSPFVPESNNGTECGSPPNGQQGVAKPKAAVPNSGFPIAPVPQEMYKGTMLRLPVGFSNGGEHAKGQSPSLIPSLSISPFIIPAFPTPILTASVQPSDLCQPLGAGLVHYPTSYDSALRHRLYPVSTWHSQPTYATSHIPAYHRNTKL